jgi:osmotically-inducible protein OsmY
VFARHKCTPTTSQRLGWLAGGALLGAAAAYLADPERGRARRSELEQRGGRIAREATETARNVVEDGTQRLAGAVREATPELSSPDDAVLIERVRSEAIGPSKARNSAIVTTVEDGVVSVRGQVDAEEQRRDLIARIGDVDGVRHVVDLTHLPSEPAPTRS